MERKGIEVEDLRTDERYYAVFQARLTCADWHMVERIATANVSKGGMFLHTENHPAVGDPVEVVLVLPTKTETIISGTVRHVIDEQRAAQLGQPVGIGIQASAGSRTEMAALAEIARLRQAPGANSS